MTSSDASYEAVAEEISSGRIDRATWTKAFGRSGGYQQTTESLYGSDRDKHLTADARQRDRRDRAPHARRHGEQLLLGVFAFVTGLCISIAAPNEPHFLEKAVTLLGFFYICRGLAGLARVGFRLAWKLAHQPPTCIMSLCDAPCTATGQDRGYTIYECSQGHEFCI